MKYLILVPDGMADEPLAELNHQTPLEAARTPNMDRMAREGQTGLVQTIPEGMSPGSDVGNLALMGYDPTKNFSGRSPLEAANMGIMLSDNEVAFRCNLVTIKDGCMEDYSAGHITTEDAEHFIKLLEQKMGSAQIAFYPGKSYRHLVVLKTHQTEHLTQLRCTPPHDITGKAVESYLPQGNGKEMILALMEEAHTILRDHPLNAGREAPVTDIWLWGQGTKPNLPRFTDKFGVKGAIISAVDLVNGIGRLAGLDVITVPGATGYYDTDYRAKAEYALEALKSRDFVYVHVEAPDEAGHNGDAKAKTEAIENFDRDIVGPVLAAYAKEDMRVLVLPDHPTPVAKRTHTSDPVPFVMYGHGIEAGNGENYSESFARTLGIKFVSGEALVRQFMNA